MGQSKRYKVLRYLATRERAGIVGTGPFDLDSALVKLDALMLDARFEALAVATELAQTRQRPGCVQCEGFKSLAALEAARPGSVPPHLLTLLTLPAGYPCPLCGGSGHNTHATLPWPAWLRRKGFERISRAARARNRGPLPPGLYWSPSEFSATCENEGERRVETRTRSFARGAHRLADPWLAVGTRIVQGRPRRWPAGYSMPDRMPAWVRGEERHADQRRGRAERERRRLDFDSMMGRTLGGYSTLDEAQEHAAGYYQHRQQRIRGGGLYLGIDRAEQPSLADAIARSADPFTQAEAMRERRDIERGEAYLRAGTAVMLVDGERLPVTFSDGTLRTEGGQPLTLLPDGSVSLSTSARWAAACAWAELEGHFDSAEPTPEPRRTYARPYKHRREIEGDWSPSEFDAVARIRERVAGVMANRGVARTTAMLEQAARHDGPVTVVAADEVHASALRYRLRRLEASHVQVRSVASVVAGSLRGRTDLVLWDHYALEQHPGIDPALYSRAIESERA